MEAPEFPEEPSVEDHGIAGICMERLVGSAETVPGSASFVILFNPQPYERQENLLVSVAQDCVALHGGELTRMRTRTGAFLLFVSAPGSLMAMMPTLIRLGPPEVTFLFLPTGVVPGTDLETSAEEIVSFGGKADGAGKPGWRGLYFDTGVLMEVFAA